MQATTREGARALLRDALGNPSAEFREGQWEAIDALVNHRERLLVVQRTGWGKSAVYFIATKILRSRGDGPALIISPLLSLMRNQHQAAARMNLISASLNQTNAGAHASLLQAFGTGRLDALLVSPERLANEKFIRALIGAKQGLGLFVIDEAHCISDWGHDFRPDYRRIAGLVKSFPVSLPVLATTATANERVREDVRNQLGNFAIQAGSLMRDSLRLESHWLGSQAERLAWLGHYIPKFEGSGIVYVLTKADAHMVASWLQVRNVRAHAYHASVVLDEGSTGPDEDRAYIEEKFLRGEGYRVLASTVALGMGFDKPDLKFVVHFQAPASVIAYYQQAGRAGRGIPHADCVLLGGVEDALIHSYFREHAFPEVEECLTVLRALEVGFPAGAQPVDLAEVVNLDESRIERALKYLAVEPEPPVFVDSQRWKRSLTAWTPDPTIAARVSAQRESEWGEVVRYSMSDDCLMQFLASSLDDSPPDSCGRCASCAGRRFDDWSDQERTEAVEAAKEFLRNRLVKVLPLRHSGPQLERAFPVDQITEAELKVVWPREGCALSRWGDSGWGELVAAGKSAGRFGDDLVEASARLLGQRWKPASKPAWLTFVPSSRRPALMKDFAHRLAKRLGLTFVDALSLNRTNDEQKLQRNTFHRCRNLDGLFSTHVPLLLKGKPGLLVDDIVDSGWSLMVAAVHLRRATGGPVHRFALASAGGGR